MHVLGGTPVRRYSSYRNNLGYKYLTTNPTHFPSTPTTCFNTKYEIAMSPTYSTTIQGRHHPDFSPKWIQDILNDPEIQWDTRPEPGYDDPRWKGRLLNTMFNITLSHEDRIRAGISFHRPSSEPDAALKFEDCYLVSLGEGLDGRPGRGHGGMSALLLDQITGSTAVHLAETTGDDPPATATLTIDFKAPVRTPGVFLVRSWVTEVSGRKVWTKGEIQDREGTVCAVAKALFIYPRPKALL